MTTATEYPRITENIVAWPETPAWDRSRNNGIGASEIAAIVGLSKWQTPLHVYERKVNGTGSDYDNRAMRIGRALEETVINEFCEETGIDVKTYPCPMVHHPNHREFRATPDAELEGGLLIDAKTANWRMADEWGEPWTDDIPAEYLCQVQWQMYVTGRDFCYVAALLGGSDLRCYGVDRNDRLIDFLVEAAHEFWGRVEDCSAPPPDFSHRSTPELIWGIYGTVEDDEVVTLDDDARAWWTAYEQIGRSIKVAEKERDELKARVSAAIGSHRGGDLGDGRWIKRSVVDRKEHTVKASSYVTMRACKKREPKE